MQANDSISAVQCVLCWIQTCPLWAKSAINSYSKPEICAVRARWTGILSLLTSDLFTMKSAGSAKGREVLKTEGI